MRNITSVNIPTIHTGDNTFAFSSQEKADALDSFFISVSDIEDANIPLPSFKNRNESVI